MRPSEIERWERFRPLGPQACARPVKCVDDGKVYPSASAAARAYKVSRSALIELCLGYKYRESVGGKVFKYVEN